LLQTKHNSENRDPNPISKEETKTPKIANKQQKHKTTKNQGLDCTTYKRAFKHHFAYALSKKMPKKTKASQISNVIQLEGIISPMV